MWLSPLEIKIERVLRACHSVHNAKPFELFFFCFARVIVVSPRSTGDSFNCFYFVFRISFDVRNLTLHSCFGFGCCCAGHLGVYACAILMTEWIAQDGCSRLLHTPSTKIELTKSRHKFGCNFQLCKSPTKYVLFHRLTRRMDHGDCHKQCSIKSHKNGLSSGMIRLPTKCPVPNCIITPRLQMIANDYWLRQTRNKNGIY